MDQSLASSTCSTYASGARTFLRFCSHIGVRPFPPSERVLCLLVFACGCFCSSSIILSDNQSLFARYTTVFYLAPFLTPRLHAPQHKPLSFVGIQFLSLFLLWLLVLLSCLVCLTNMHYLYYTLCGICRFQGNSLHLHQRNPITIQHLFIISGSLTASGFSEKNKAMWRRVTLLAFFGLLRVSKYFNIRFDTQHLSRFLSTCRFYSSPIYLPIENLGIHFIHNGATAAGCRSFSYFSTAYQQVPQARPPSITYHKSTMHSSFSMPTRFENPSRPPLFLFLLVLFFFLDPQAEVQHH